MKWSVPTASYTEWSVGVVRWGQGTVVKGTGHADGFNAEKMAKETLEVYKKLA